jgi:hypothetical protein
VYDPGDNLPVYNALVYVPVGAVEPPAQAGVSTTNPVCGCSAPQAYASAYTDVSGHFTLTNVPSGSVNIVVQLGKWQRVFPQTVVSCQSNTASNGAYGSHLTLPSSHKQGNIPLFAVDTGGGDSMECVLSKMGISTSEFVNADIVNGVPTNAGRVHLYEGATIPGGAIGGAIIDQNTPPESALTEVASVMDSYDVLLFPCKNALTNYTAPTWPNTVPNVTAYANAGGRVFATHYHEDLLGGFSGIATWGGTTTHWGPAPPLPNGCISLPFTAARTG